MPIVIELLVKMLSENDDIYYLITNCGNQSKLTRNAYGNLTNAIEIYVFYFGCNYIKIDDIIAEKFKLKDGK